MNTDFVLVSKNELTVRYYFHFKKVKSKQLKAESFNNLWSLSSIETLNLFASFSKTEIGC
ncbi:hypothetical protein CWC05_09805 [Pseudoalteromonas ruthenica]|uniref:Uncharacterized protein n=1 Tax=Pseudoalteromonas ruthenica TaxID=151081 RepID=A0A5S3Z567_9GAMM|nr:hypothetical protein CWC05_09805 [Pseudoalteromonas ruthenica]